MANRAAVGAMLRAPLLSRQLAYGYGLNHLIPAEVVDGGVVVVVLIRLSSMRVRASLLLVGLVARVRPRIACGSALCFAASVVCPAAHLPQPASIWSFILGGNLMLAHSKAAQPRSSEKNAASRAGQTPCARWAVGICYTRAKSGGNG